MTESAAGVWRNCNICKSAMAFGSTYFLCSVSTCNRKRTGLFFCSLACFEAHLPTARHRDAWAEQQRAPTEAEWRAALEADAAEERPEPMAPARVTEAATSAAEPDAHEVLVVVSKLKKYVRDRSGMNTSDAVMAVLSDHLRDICREAIRQAGADGRRTVLDRDVVKVLRERAGGQRSR